MHTSPLDTFNGIYIDSFRMKIDARPGGLPAHRHLLIEITTHKANVSMTTGVLQAPGSFKTCRQEHKPGDVNVKSNVILFSPGCASGHARVGAENDGKE